MTTTDSATFSSSNESTNSPEAVTTTLPSVISTFITNVTLYTASVLAGDVTTQDVNVTTHVFDTYNYFIHPHWRQFPLVSDTAHYIAGVVITIVGFCGIFGNAIVIWMFTREKSLRTSSNMFIVNLAISDMTFCIVNGFPLFSVSAFSKRWVFGQAACEFYGLIGGVFGLMSINTMVMIAIDRYMAIARPIHVAKSMTRKKAFFMIVIVWLWSLATCLPPIFGWGRYIPEGFGTSCTFDYLTRSDNNRSYIFFMYIFGFAVPLGVLFGCYGLILRAVKNHEIEMKKTAKKMNAEIRTNQEEKRMEIKVAKIAMTILILYLLSWTPYATVALIAQFGDASFVTPFWSEIPVLFAKASAMHNPIVYALSHPKFRAAIHNRIPWLLCCCDSGAKDATISRNNTYQDRNASRRSTTSVIGNASVDSEMSNLEDTSYADMEFRLRRLEEQTKKTPKSERGAEKGKKKTEVPADDIPVGRIIQDLTNALIEIAFREKHGDGGNSAHSPSTSASRHGGGDPSLVLDSSKLPELAKYALQMTRSNSLGGSVNQALDLAPESSEVNTVPSSDADPSEREARL